MEKNSMVFCTSQPMILGLLVTPTVWAGNVDDKKSTSGYIFHLGSGAISWASKKPLIMSLSTTKFEYVAATTGAC